MRKGEIACNKQFLLFLTMFSTLYGTYFPFQMYFKMSSAICFNLDQSEMLSSGNGLMWLRLCSLSSTEWGKNLGEKSEKKKWEKKCWLPAFPPTVQCLQRASLQGSLKTMSCVVKG